MKHKQLGLLVFLFLQYIRCEIAHKKDCDNNGVKERIDVSMRSLRERERERDR